MTKVETQDLYCGAYLLACGSLLDHMRLADGRNGKPSVTFIFAGEDAARQLREFNSGLAMTNAATFKAAMIHLKDVMFEKLRATAQQKESTPYGRTQSI